MKQELLYGIIGLLAGSLFTFLIVTSVVNNNNRNAMGMMGMGQHNSMMDNGTSQSMSSGMDMMTNSLKGKTGDDFDKAFINAMIVHHQGAIDMAKEAKQNAKHDEIKKLSNDIIEAQTKEINEMNQWKQQWGY